jgi:hypothetical protein
LPSESFRTFAIPSWSELGKFNAKLESAGNCVAPGAAGAKIAEVTPNETRVFDVSNNHGDAMKTLNISLLASGIGTAVGLGA